MTQANQIKSNVGFEERGKLEYAEKNLSEQSREPTNSVHIIMMLQGPGVEPGTNWWKASAPTTVPTLLPYMRKQCIQSLIHIHPLRDANLILTKCH